MGFFTNESKTLDRLTGELDQIRQVANRENLKLAELKETLAGAERAVADALGDGAIHGDDRAAQKAQATVTEARAAVDLQRALVSAVRAKLWTGGGTAAAAVEGAAPERLAEEARAAAERFAGEWATAAENWAAILGRRVQIERLTGRGLALPMPTALPGVDVDDLLPLAVALDNLRKMLSQVGGVDRTDPTPDETTTHGSFEDNLRALEATDRLRRSKARAESLAAEGR